MKIAFDIGGVLSSPDFCRTHLLPGREAIQRGEIEWFTVSAAGAGKEEGNNG